MFDNYIRKVVEVVRVLDGDTVDICIDLGHNTYHISKHRLDCFDAPETWRPSTETEREAGEKVTNFLIETLEQCSDCLYVITSKDPKIYGRYTAILFADGTDYPNLVNINEKVADFMKDNGLTKEQLKMYKE